MNSKTSPVIIIRREMQKVPQIAITMAVSCPPTVCGKISPYPTVVIVITVSQIAEP